jgi:hypothetical protein
MPQLLRPIRESQSFGVRGPSFPRAAAWNSLGNLYSSTSVAYFPTFTKCQQGQHLPFTGRLSSAVSCVGLHLVRGGCPYGNIRAYFVVRTASKPAREGLADGLVDRLATSRRYPLAIRTYRRGVAIRFIDRAVPTLDDRSTSGHYISIPRSYAINL